jgi:glycosyl transferase family 1
LAVLRRSLMSPNGVGRVVAAWAADAGGLGRLARSRDVALVHTNTSLTLGGTAAARVAGVPHVWHVREIYAGFERWFPAYRRLLLSAQALPCVSRAACLQFDAAPEACVLNDGLAVDARRGDRARTWSPSWRARLAARLGVLDRLHDVGFQDELELLYGAADVVVVPSKQPDPLPNAALEACAAGCCVVAAAHGGLPEIVRDGETGRLVTPRDPAALAGVLAELAADPGQRAASAGERRSTCARALPARACSRRYRRSTTACSPARDYSEVQRDSPRRMKPTDLR